VDRGSGLRGCLRRAFELTRNTRRHYPSTLASTNVGTPSQSSADTPDERAEIFG